MLPGNTDKINYVELPHPNKMLAIESLDYNNPYDFKKMHRHDYFEVIFVKHGNGSQLIDFTSYPITTGEMYIIYPGQVHLMNRDTAQGLVIQFKKNIFEYIHPINHYNLYSPSALVNADEQLFEHLYSLTERIKELISVEEATLSSIAKHKAYSYLQIILLSLVEINASKISSDKDRHLFEEYLSLISSHIHNMKKVSEYATQLNCSPDKLNDACKKALGKTALELIHEELILEIRRLLLLNEMTLKEMSYHLNFDSQSNFSGFIKAQTGMTPKELQETVLDIYN